MDLMKKQSERFGTTIISETISRVDLSSRPFRLWREGNDEDDADAILADSIVIATGATAKRLHIDGEEEFWQAGISACASEALVVVGGGDSASEEATFLTKFASKVYVLVRRNKLRASKVMADRLLNHPKVEVLWNKIPKRALGDRLLRRLVIEDTVTGEETELETSGLFYAIGHKPNTEVFSNQLDLHDTGYIKTFAHNGVPSTYTSVEGVFACGDVQDFTYRQAVTAAGSGYAAERETKLRYQLKKWEVQFNEKYGRLPSKDDIQKNPEALKKYKEYSRLKKLRQHQAEVSQSDEHTLIEKRPRDSTSHDKQQLVRSFSSLFKPSPRQLAPDGNHIDFTPTKTSTAKSPKSATASSKKKASVFSASRMSRLISSKLKAMNRTSASKQKSGQSKRKNPTSPGNSSTVLSRLNFQDPSEMHECYLDTPLKRIKSFKRPKASPMGLEKQDYLGASPLKLKDDIRPLKEAETCDAESSRNGLTSLRAICDRKPVKSPKGMRREARALTLEDCGLNELISASKIQQNPKGMMDSTTAEIIASPKKPRTESFDRLERTRKLSAKSPRKLQKKSNVEKSPKKFEMETAENEHPKENQIQSLSTTDNSRGEQKRPNPFNVSLNKTNTLNEGISEESMLDAEKENCDIKEVRWLVSSYHGTRKASKTSSTLSSESGNGVMSSNDKSADLPDRVVAPMEFLRGRRAAKGRTGLFVPSFSTVPESEINGLEGNAAGSSLVDTEQAEGVTSTNDQVPSVAMKAAQEVLKGLSIRMHTPDANLHAEKASDPNVLDIGKTLHPPIAPDGPARKDKGLTKETEDIESEIDNILLRLGLQQDSNSIANPGKKAGEGHEANEMKLKRTKQKRKQMIESSEDESEAKDPSAGPVEILSPKIKKKAKKRARKSEDSENIETKTKRTKKTSETSKKAPKADESDQTKKANAQASGWSGAGKSQGQGSRIGSSNFRSMKLNKPRFMRGSSGRGGNKFKNVARYTHETDNPWSSQILAELDKEELEQMAKVPDWPDCEMTSYLTLSITLQELFPSACVLGLTGTATFHARKALVEALGIDEDDVISLEPTRPNLKLSVSDESILSALNSPQFSNLNSIIIYTMFQSQADHIAQFLRVRNFDAESYHSGRTPVDRMTVQRRFMDGRLRIVVATIAFGLGVNKMDVRSVIHYNMPKSIENYVQEVGRAGRDGLDAICHVFLSKEDYVKHRSFAHSETIDESSAWRFIQRVLGEHCQTITHDSSDGYSVGVIGDKRLMFIPIEGTEQELDIKESVLLTILCYIEMDKRRPIRVLQEAFRKYSVRFIKSRPEDLADEVKAIELIIRHCKKAKGNCIEFDILKKKKEIIYEPLERSFQLELLIDMDYDSPESIEYLENLRKDIMDRISCQERSRVLKLDQLYEMLSVAARKSPFQETTGAADESEAAEAEETSRWLHEKIKHYFDVEEEVHQSGGLEADGGSNANDATQSTSNEPLSKWAFRDADLINKAQAWYNHEMWGAYTHISFGELARIANKILIDFRTRRNKADGEKDKGKGRAE
ncbi:thioredoxin-disulfide reductase [Phlyctochytrium bullatum]|nr:thioredoxin-disulfide reductase [Phlyctochytrium bullatum]